MIKILQIGCGSISAAWLSAMTARDDIKICGMVDLSRETAMQRAEQFDLDCPVYTNIEKAITELEPDAAVDNILPAGRTELAEICMSNGLHVMSEKPLADDMKNAGKIIALSDEYDRQYSVMQNRRYNTGMFSFRNTIQKGVIGDIGYIGAEFFRDPHFGGFRDSMDSPLLLDMAIHTFDQARFLLGADPVSVICKEYNPGWSWYKGKASAVCIFTFDNGTVFNYTASWCAPGMKTSWDSSWRASGSLGTCIWDGIGMPAAETTAPDSASRHPADKSVEIEKVQCDPSGHAGCIDEMIDSLKNGKRSATDCRDNIRSLAMVFAAIKSSDEKREVYIEEILEV